ncbi:MAG: hypothetical protein ABS46_20390 [Cytophagaceae bacterium SCN 52-12]|nr:MAG: hypothetical protein ABS46_20390 [Cytophagaceae bacterium SCN 52-12]
MRIVSSFIKGTLVAAALISAPETGAQKLSKTTPAGKNIYELAFDQQHKVIYVASVGVKDNPALRPHIIKLEAKTLKVLDSIGMEHGPAFGLAINNRTQTLYASNTVTNSVLAVDLKSGRQTLIPSGKESSHTRELVVDEDANIIYVSDVVGREDPGRIWVIDGNTNTLKKMIETGGSVTTGLALDKENNRLYISNWGSHQIGIIDLAQDKEVKTFDAGGKQPTNLAYDAKGKRLFVTNQESGDVTVLSVPEGKLITKIATGKGALGIRFDPERKRGFVANRGAGTVTVFDSETYRVLADLKTGTHPNTVVLDNETGTAYVTNKAGAPGGQGGAADRNGDTVSLIAP